MKTSIIGAGNMGKAFYDGIDSTDVHLCDRNKANLATAPENCRFTNALKATENVDCIVLAVKPQSFPELMKEVGDSWSSKFIISIMAGISLSQLEKLTSSSHLVRSMPNLGSKIQRGVAGWCTSADVTNKEREHVESLFSGIGMSIELPSEDAIDAFTVIAGSGPAYVFGLAELLQQNAMKQLGLTSEVASRIATEVIAAGSLLLEEGTMTASEWRKAVTSKGGVTEAALNVFEDKKLTEIFDDALSAGTLRSKTLSSDND